MVQFVDADGYTSNYKQSLNDANMLMEDYLLGKSAAKKPQNI